ncbi:MAG: winged helix-turn-helix domain-containing protein [Thermomicrobiales bacterium]
MASETLTRSEAQWLAVTAQGLNRRPFRRRPTKQEILETIRRLGCVQLDTISVISRTHETVLWSRLGPYDTNLIAELYDPDHAITEYWAHAAAIIPVEFMPLFRTYMEARRENGGWSDEPENRATMDRLLALMATTGPLSSQDFEAPEGSRKAEAWEWHGIKPERRALEALWTRGEIVLRRRDGFRRVYDLPERIVPALWDDEPLPEDARLREFVTRAVSALGVATAGWTVDYFRTSSPQHVSLQRAKEWLQRLEDEGEIVRVTVPGIDEPVWMDNSLRERLDRMRQGNNRPTLTTLLSPFDNLIWNRNRNEQLWDYHYRLECYTPAHKRIYGYYSLTILHKGRLIGRLDPSYDRKTRVLTIKALHVEPGVRVSTAMVGAITGAIEDLLRFLGGDPGSWRLLHTNSGEIRSIVASTGKFVSGE